MPEGEADALLATLATAEHPRRMKEALDEFALANSKKDSIGRLETTSAHQTAAETWALRNGTI